jgi:hypothetical protein
MIQLKGGNLFCVYQIKGYSCASQAMIKAKHGAIQHIDSCVHSRYEMAVPEVLELKDHSLWHRTTRGRINKRQFGILPNTLPSVTKKSYDKGKTWTDERLIYEAHYNFDDGCWEPSQLQLPSGEIQLFFQMKESTHIQTSKIFPYSAQRIMV